MFLNLGEKSGKKIRDVPCVGISFGIERLFAIMEMKMKNEKVWIFWIKKIFSSVFVTSFLWVYFKLDAYLCQFYFIFLILKIFVSSPGFFGSGSQRLFFSYVLFLRLQGEHCLPWKKVGIVLVPTRNPLLIILK